MDDDPERLKRTAIPWHKIKDTITELDYYLSERVKELTDGKQTPATAKPSTIQDFPIAVKKGM